MLFVGDDWAEDHHDVALINEEGRLLVRRRLPEGVQGIEALHGLIADHLDEQDGCDQVVVGIETGRGPWVAALLAANYTVFAVNPLQAARYRERHGTSGAKSDKGDALVLALLVQTDHAHHRPIIGDSDAAEEVKVLARSHQSLIWARQRQVNVLRSNLREYFPAALAAFGGALADRDAIAVLAVAPGPEKARKLSSAKVQSLLRKAGRSRYLKSRADEITSALQSEQLEARAPWATWLTEGRLNLSQQDEGRRGRGVDKGLGSPNGAPAAGDTLTERLAHALPRSSPPTIRPLGCRRVEGSRDRWGHCCARTPSPAPPPERRTESSWRPRDQQALPHSVHVKVIEIINVTGATIGKVEAKNTGIKHIKRTP